MVLIFNSCVVFHKFFKFFFSHESGFNFSSFKKMHFWEKNYDPQKGQDAMHHRQLKPKIFQPEILLKNSRYI